MLSFSVLLWFLPLVFLIAAIGTITGGQSLITVPLLILVGLSPRHAVATNMFAVTFLSLGGTVSFVRSNILPRHLLQRLGWVLALLTLGTSALGAAITVQASDRVVSLLVPLSMLIFGGLLPFSQLAARPHLGRPLRMIGYGLSALLGVYGGAYSGGYTTVLTMVCTIFFGLTLLEAVALTKFINLFSCGAATAVFAAYGLIDWRLGGCMAVAMFAGALVGARFALQLPQRTLRIGFALSVVAMATLLFLR